VRSPGNSCGWDASREVERPEPSTIVGQLDIHRQVIVRITPEKALMHD
jgi:hypothetical protein